MEKKIKDVIKIESIHSAFEAHYDEDFYYAGEFHPFWEMVFVLDGSVGVSGDGRVYSLSKGSIAFHKPMEFHRIWANDKTKPHLFIMSFSAWGSAMKSLENGIFKLNAAQEAKAGELFEFFKNSPDGKNIENGVNDFLLSWGDDAYFSQNVANRAEAFLLSVASDFKKVRIEQDRSEEIKVFKDVITILTENVCKNLSLDDIAKKCGRSKSQIKKNFAKVSDIGIHKYYLKLKIAKAITLLEKGMTVSEAGEMLSFGSANYFSMVFKRETGLSPLQYKKHQNPDINNIKA